MIDELLFNGVVLTKGAQFVTIGISNFYLKHSTENQAKQDPHLDSPRIQAKRQSNQRQILVR